MCQLVNLKLGNALFLCYYYNGALGEVGGSRKKYSGAWPLIIWDATTAKRNYYRSD